MKRKIAIIFILFSVFLYANIVDERRIFSDKSKLELNSLIEKIKEEEKCEVYLGTFFSEDEIEIKQRKRVIVVNMLKPKNEKQLKIQLKVSQDLNSQELSEEFSNVLRELGEIVEENDEFVVSKEVLRRIDIILKRNRENLLDKIEKKIQPKRKIDIVSVRRIRDIFALLFTIIIILIALLPKISKNYKLVKGVFKQTRSIKITFLIFVTKIKKSMKKNKNKK